MATSRSAWALAMEASHVVLAEGHDQALLVLDLLDVAGDDLHAEGVHVGLGLGLHLVAELLAVGVQLLELDGADDLAHVALQRVGQRDGDAVLAEVQEVLHRDLDALGVGLQTDLRDGVDVHADEVLRRHVAVGLDIDADLLEHQRVLSFEEGQLDAGAADQDLRVLLHARDDIGLVGRSLDVAADEQREDGCGRRSREDIGNAIHT